MSHLFKKCVLLLGLELSMLFTGVPVNLCQAEIIAVNGQYYLYRSETDSSLNGVYLQSGQTQNPAADSRINSVNQFGLVTGADGNVLTFTTTISTEHDISYQQNIPVFSSGIFANQKTAGEAYYVDEANIIVDAATDKKITIADDELSYYFFNGQPVSSINGEQREIYNMDGEIVTVIPNYEAKLDAPYEPSHPTDINFSDAYLKPKWNDPQDTTPDGQNPSGILKLNGGTDIKGWNGSELRYFFVDTSESDQKAYDHAIADATLQSVLAAESYAATVANVPFPNVGAGILSAAIATTATAQAASFSTRAAELKKYTSNFVGAIDFSGDFHVTGGGNLNGTYQNLNSMSITDGNYSLGGNIFVVDSLMSSGNLSIANSGKVIYVDNVNISGTLENKGSVDGINTLIISKALTNSGTMQMIDTLNADSMNNSGTFSGREINLNGTLTNSGSIQLDGNLYSESISTSKTLFVSGSVTTGDFQNTKSESDTSLVFISETLDAQNITNYEVFSVVGKTSAASLTNQGGTMSLGDLNLTNELRNDGSVTSTGFLKTDSISNSGSIIFKTGIEADGTITMNAPTTGTAMTFLGTNGKILAGNINLYAGKIYAGTGLETGNLTVDTGELLSNGALIADNVINNGAIIVNGSVNADNINTSNSWISQGDISVAGNVNSAGTFSVTGTLNIGGTFTNSAQTAVTGSIQAQSLNNAENGVLDTLDNVKIKENIENAGTVSILGNLEGKNLKNSSSGLMNLAGNAKLLSFTNENLVNFAGQMEISKNLSNDGNLIGTSANSSLLIGGNMENNTNSQIEKIRFVEVNGTVNNQGKITGRGFSSTFTAFGNVANDGEISNFESVLLESLENSGNIETSTFLANSTVINSGIMLGTDEGSVFKFNENLVNSGNISCTEKVTVKQNIENTGNITGTGKDSKLSVDASLNNARNAKIENFESVEINGNVINEGTIIASGEGSSYVFESLLNPGKIQNVEKLTVQTEANVSGSVEGSGNGSCFRTSSLTGNGIDEAFDGSITNFGEFTNASALINEGIIAGTGKLSIFNQAGDLTNRTSITDFQYGNILGNVTNEGTAENQALISGIGTDSTLTITGNVSNLENAQIKDIERINISGNLNNAGTLKNFQGISVDGTFTNSETGLLDLTLQDGELSKITVHGGEAFINGGKVVLNGEPLQIGEKYSFIIVENIDPAAENGGLTVNQELTIDTSENSSAVPKLFHVAGFHNQNEYWVTLCREVVYGQIDVKSPNQHNVGTYLDRLAYSLNTKTPYYEENDLVKVLSTLDDLSMDSGETPSSSSTLENALDQLGGGIYANQGILAMQNTWFAHQNLASFIRPLDTIFNECDHPELRGNNLWGGFVGNSGNIDADSNFNGFSFDSAGVIAGYDFFRSSSFRAGAYFHFMNTSVSQRGLSANSDADQYDLGLYGLYQNDYGYLMASGNLSYGNYSVDRKIAFGSENEWIDRSHHGKRDSFQQSLRVETAANIVFAGGHLIFRPFVGLTYVHLTMNDVAESGADQFVTAIQSKGFDLNSLRPEIGFRLGSAFKTDWAAIGLNLRASWVHEFCNTKTIVENKFSNPNYGSQACGYGPAFTDTAASFLVTGTDLGRDYAWFGFGFSADTRRKWTFFGGYDAFANGRTVIHTGNLGISFNW